MWGEKDGLTPKQIVAVSQLFENIDKIKANATLAIVNFLTQIDFLQPILPKDLLSNPETIWQYLQPGYSEIRDSADIALGFSLTFLQDLDDHLLYINVVNGEFVEVSSE